MVQKQITKAMTGRNNEKDDLYQKFQTTDGTLKEQASEKLIDIQDLFMEGVDDQEEGQNDEEIHDITRKKIDTSKENPGDFEETGDGQLKKDKELIKNATKAKQQYLEMFNNKELVLKEVFNIKRHKDHSSIDFDVAVRGDRKFLIVKFISH